MEPVLADLLPALEAARAVQDARRRTVEVLAAHGYPMPSVYLERGGRLRCFAIRGYWQILDGVPPETGVLGRTFTAGAPVEFDDVEAAPDYLAVASRVRAETCVPVPMVGAVIGVLNVESPDALPAGATAVLTEAAAALGRRIGQLGGPPGESPAQRLVRHTATITSRSTEAEVLASSLAAALDLAGFTSAAALMLDGGSLAVARTSGRLAASLASLDVAAVELLTGRVLMGISSYTSGHPAEGTEGYDELARMGVASVIGVPMTLGGEVLGVLLLVDERNLRAATSTVELLELLGTQTAVCVRAARIVETLRDRAALDPLTGLGHHATFTRALHERVHPHRSAVYAIDVDHFKTVNDTLGHQAGDRLLVAIADALAADLREGDTLYRIGGDEFAAVVDVHGTEDALGIGHRLVETARRLGHGVSVGVAIARPGETGETVLGRADRALYRVKRGGRDGVSLSGHPRDLETGTGDALDPPA
jgi:diguanylate cyclase (GGDEF)-like protein